MEHRDPGDQNMPHGLRVTALVPATFWAGASRQAQRTSHEGHHRAQSCAHSRHLPATPPCREALAPQGKRQRLLRAAWERGNAGTVLGPLAGTLALQPALSLPTPQMHEGALSAWVCTLSPYPPRHGQRGCCGEHSAPSAPSIVPHKSETSLLTRNGPVPRRQGGTEKPDFREMPEPCLEVCAAPGLSEESRHVPRWSLGTSPGE